MLWSTDRLEYHHNKVLGKFTYLPLNMLTLVLATHIVVMMYLFQGTSQEFLSISG